MRQYVFIGLITVLTTLLATASANDTLLVTDIWSRATPPLAEVGAAYLTVKNRGSTPDRLIGIDTPVAQHAEIHTHIMQEGMMMMRQLEAIDLPAGGSIVFKPGGNHIMLMGLGQALQEGESFPLTLKFEHSGRIELIVEVRALGSL